MHVHVYCGDGEAKFWLEPEVALAYELGGIGGFCFGALR
jgi:hypothetical protein